MEPQTYINILRLPYAALNLPSILLASTEEFLFLS